MERSANSHTRYLHGPLDYLEVLLPFGLEPVQGGIAAHHDDLQRGEGEGDDAVLRDHRHLVAISLRVSSEMDLPSTRTVPARGWSARLMHFNSVVLPDPLGPRIPTISPGLASKFTSSSILALL